MVGPVTAKAVAGYELLLFLCTVWKSRQKHLTVVNTKEIPHCPRRVIAQNDIHILMVNLFNDVNGFLRRKEMGVFFSFYAK